MPHVYSGVDLKWRGLELYLGRRRVAEVVREPAWPGLYRVVTLHDLRVSDMVNLTRAKDAAVVLSSEHLNAGRRRVTAEVS